MQRQRAAPGRKSNFALTGDRKIYFLFFFLCEKLVQDEETVAPCEEESLSLSLSL